MNQPSDQDPRAGAGHPSTTPDAPTLAEDLMLLLFQPSAGMFAGETTLFYVLAGAVLAELGLGDHVRTEGGRDGTARVRAVGGHPPSDEVLRSAWDGLERPQGVQTALASIGPPLRATLLERLVDRGDLRRARHKVFGLIPTTVLQDGGSGRRAGLVADVRAVLADGAEPSPRVATLAALVSGSGTLHQLHQEIPWTSAVIARAKELERGDWGARAAADAVTRTVTATVIGAVVTATAGAGR